MATINKMRSKHYVHRSLTNRAAVTTSSLLSSSTLFCDNVKSISNKIKLPPVNGHPLWFDQQNYLSNPKPESEKKYCRILSLFSSRKPLKGNCFHNGKWPPLSAQSIIWTPTSVHLRLLILAIICVPEFNVPFIRSTYESAHQTHVKRNCLNSTLWMKN